MDEGLLKTEIGCCGENSFMVLVAVYFKFPNFPIQESFYSLSNLCQTSFCASLIFYCRSIRKQAYQSCWHIVSCYTRTIKYLVNRTGEFGRLIFKNSRLFLKISRAILKKRSSNPENQPTDLQILFRCFLKYPQPVLRFLSTVPAYFKVFDSSKTSAIFFCFYSFTLLFF